MSNEYKWDLSSLFKSNKECEEYAINIKAKCNEFSSKFKGKLSKLSKDEFLHSLSEYEKLNESIAAVGTYAFLVFAQDTKQGAYYAKMEQECTYAYESLLFFTLEFNSLSDDLANEFMDQNPKYGYFLKNTRANKPHELSLEQEQVLLRTSNTGASAFARLFDETLSNLKFTLDNEILSEEEVLARLYSPDREQRKKAALSLSQGLQDKQHLLGYIYNMIKTDLSTNCELRNYDTPETFRHIDNQITKSSVDSLIFATENSFEFVHDFYNTKREILGLDKLYDYDRYAPLSSDEKSIEYEEAKSIVISAFSNFSSQFGKIANEAFENGWIDVYPTDGKRGGAFSHGAVSYTHPYVLLNYTNQIRDVFTLAHELGHAIHQKLSYSVGYLNADTPLTTAETASVFCEMLVFEYVKKTLDANQKRALIARKLEDIFATLYRQINFTTFERAVHSQSGELSLDQFNELWLNESKKMFGQSVVLNDYYKIWWSYIPHFIHSPFYCYAYSYAQLLVLALFGLYKSGKCKNFVELYIEFLSSGGSRSPKELVGLFGFDIDDSKFWQIGLNQIRELVDEFKEMK